MQTLHEHKPPASAAPQLSQKMLEEYAQAEPLTTAPQVSRRLRRKRLMRRRNALGRRGAGMLLKTCGMCFVGLGLVCATFAVEFLIVCIWLSLTPHHDIASDLPGLIVAARVGMSVATLALIGGLLYKLGTRANKRAAVLHDVLLNSASTADLPAPESLVRASSEPRQAQETILLRAAAGTQEDPQELLLRAYTDK